MPVFIQNDTLFQALSDNLREETLELLNALMTYRLVKTNMKGTVYYDPEFLYKTEIKFDRKAWSLYEDCAFVEVDSDLVSTLENYLEEDLGNLYVYEIDDGNSYSVPMFRYESYEISESYYEMSYSEVIKELFGNLDFKVYA